MEQDTELGTYASVKQFDLGSIAKALGKEKEDIEASCI